MNFSGKIEFYRTDDSVLIVEYEGYDDPGKVSGPPEDCYPPDSEMNITSIKSGDLEIEVLDDELQLINQKCWDDVEEMFSTQDEPEYYAELNRCYAHDRI